MGVISLVLHPWCKPSWSRYHLVSFLHCLPLVCYLSVFLSIYSVCKSEYLAVCLSVYESGYLFGFLNNSNYSSSSISLSLSVTVPRPLTTPNLLMVQWCPLWSSCGITCNVDFALLRRMCRFQHICQWSLGQLTCWVTYQHKSRNMQHLHLENTFY